MVASGHPGSPCTHAATLAEMQCETPALAPPPQPAAELRCVGPISSPGQLQLLWLIALGEMKIQARLTAW